MTVGASGHMPVIAIKTFYAGAAPTVSMHYNHGNEATPDWREMTLGQKGTAMAMGVLNTVHVSGDQNSSGTEPIPVTKPSSNENWNTEQWVQTEL